MIGLWYSARAIDLPFPCNVQRHNVSAYFDYATVREAVPAYRLLLTHASPDKRPQWNLSTGRQDVANHINHRFQQRYTDHCESKFGETGFDNQTES